MKILFTASECVPFCKTGGLADVVGALAPVLAKKGHDVRVMIPLYSMIPQDYVSQMKHVLDFEVELGWRKQYCGIEALEKDGVTYYFIDNKYYFGRSYIYGMGGDEYERYGFFDRACLNALTLLDFAPDILHAHDWQAGMIPALLKIQYQHLPFYAGIKTVFTIHNLQYQGIFGIPEVQDVLGLGDEVFTNDKLECYGCANFMKAALVYSDEITTVSPSYAEEIQTAYYGERMEGLLRARKHSLSGVLNGIDVGEYDPANDPLIPARYTVDDMSGKAVCKAELQKELGLEVNADVPVISLITRLSNQKGLDLIDRVIGEIMAENVQLVVLGMGDARYVNLFSWAEQHYPGRVAARFRMDGALAHRIYAASDMFLMPSQFEPCGLSQMIALRYGTLPIVRETGGLRDTVLSYNEANNAGNGFTFFNYNAHDMLFTIRRALMFYNKNKEVWKMLQKRGMEGDYSWAHSAETYLSLYQDMLKKPEEKGEVKEEEKPEVEVVVEVAVEKKPRKRTCKPKAETAEKPAAEKKPRAPRKKKTEA
ncbi:MAG: glycogen synthase GlgA [Clostridia bacterium]|nr:glycogen synthase GlgA [Clostridia bacterium]MBR6753482.1 glycogen synthase GlgA [Clostridia bacterium]